MPYAEWNEEYSVNVSEMDRQHQILLDILNELQDAIMQHKGFEVLDNIFDELVDYTDIHFTREEELLHKYGYPSIDAHIKEHKSLTDQVMQFRSTREAGEHVVPISVYSFLVDWLITHIKGSDKKYGAFLNANGVS